MAVACSEACTAKITSNFFRESVSSVSVVVAIHRPEFSVWRVFVRSKFAVRMCALAFTYGWTLDTRKGQFGLPSISSWKRVGKRDTGKGSLLHGGRKCNP